MSLSKGNKRITMAKPAPSGPPPAATGRAAQIRELEEEIRGTPYNKATQKHVGMLKAKLARLRQQQEEVQARKSGKRGLGFGVRKAGDATVLLIGFPSVGKSTLLNALTNADSAVADYDFTTLSVVPGMMVYGGARIQLLDMPGMISGASSGRGRGREILSMTRAADLICLVLDASKDYMGQLGVIRQELHEAGFRLGESPPDIRLHGKLTGGISITMARHTGRKPRPAQPLSHDTIKAILQEFGVTNADIVFRHEPTVTADRLSRGQQGVHPLPYRSQQGGHASEGAVHGGQRRCGQRRHSQRHDLHLREAGAEPRKAEGGGMGEARLYARLPQEDREGR